MMLLIAAMLAAGAPSRADDDWLADARVEQLVTELRDADWSVRRRAAFALGQLGPAAKAAVPALIQALGDPKYMVRFDAVDALGRVGPPAEPAVPALARLFPDGDDAMRLNLVRTFGAIGRPAQLIIPLLLDGLVDGRPLTRRAAAEALGSYGSASSHVAGLARAVQDPDHEVRLAAVGSLAKLERPDATVVAALVEAFMEDPDSPVHTTSAAAMERFGAGVDGAPIVTALTALLAEPATHVRTAAATTLGGIGGKARPAVPALVAALKDPLPKVRAAAARALGRIGPDSDAAIAALTAAREDEDVTVSLSAADALPRRRLGENPAVPTEPVSASAAGTELRTLRVGWFLVVVLVVGLLVRLFRRKGAASAG